MRGTAALFLLAASLAAIFTPLDAQLSQHLPTDLNADLPSQPRAARATVPPVVKLANGVLTAAPQSKFPGFKTPNLGSGSAANFPRGDSWGQLRKQRAANFTREWRNRTEGKGSGKRKLFGRQTAPTSFDLSNVNGVNYLTSVKDQGGCGTCVSFATIGALEVTLRYSGNGLLSLATDLPDLSEQWIYYCLGKRGCNDGWWIDTGVITAATYGSYDEKCMPYSTTTGCGTLSCPTTANWGTNGTGTLGYAALSTWDAIKLHIATKGPISTGFTVYSDFPGFQDSSFYSFTSSYVWPGTKTNVVLGGHAVMCYGYDDNMLNGISATSKGVLFCRNSWGTWWGANGHFKIAYGADGIMSGYGDSYGFTFSPAPRTSTKTNTPTPTQTKTNTLTATATRTNSATQTASQTKTLTPTTSASASMTKSATASATLTASATKSATSTPSTTNAPAPPTAANDGAVETTTVVPPPEPATTELPLTPDPVPTTTQEAAVATTTEAVQPETTTEAVQTETQTTESQTETPTTESQTETLSTSTASLSQTNSKTKTPTRTTTVRPASTSTATATVTARCKGESLEIRCPKSSYIFIRDSFWGRNVSAPAGKQCASRECNNRPVCGGPSMAVQSCTGKAGCKIEINNAKLGKPIGCENSAACRYASVTYECRTQTQFSNNLAVSNVAWELPTRPGEKDD